MVRTVSPSISDLTLLTAVGSGSCVLIVEASTSGVALLDEGGEMSLDMEERKAARCTRTRLGSAWSPSSNLGRLLGYSDAMSGEIGKLEAK